MKETVNTIVQILPVIILGLVLLGVCLLMYGSLIIELFEWIEDKEWLRPLINPFGIPSAQKMTDEDYAREIIYKNRLERRKREGIDIGKWNEDFLNKFNSNTRPLIISPTVQQSGTKNLGTVQAITRNKNTNLDYIYWLDDNGQMHEKRNGEYVPVKSEFAGAELRSKRKL